MKYLCLITPTFSKGDGQGRVNYETVLELLKRGYHLFLVSSRISNDLLTHPQVTWKSIEVDNWPTALLKGLIFSFRSSQWIRQNFEKFDLVLTNGAFTRFPSDINSAHFVHAAWLKSPNYPFRKNKSLYTFYQWVYTRLNSIREQKAFQQARCVVAVSNQVKLELQATGVSAEKIKVIFNGVDPDEFHPGEVVRSTVGLPPKVSLAIFAGDIRTSRKNLDSVLKALKKVPDLHLAVVGSVERSPYPALARELAIDQRVHFLGYRQDIPNLMRASDFLVFPSRYETFGLVVLEAMASGIPVITSVATPAAELLTPDAGVVISDPEDVSTLAKEMQSLSQDVHKRERMGACARAIAENHSWDRMAQQYGDLFEKLAQSC